MVEEVVGGIFNSVSNNSSCANNEVDRCEVADGGTKAVEETSDATTRVNIVAKDFIVSNPIRRLILLLVLRRRNDCSIRSSLTTTIMERSLVKPSYVSKKKAEILLIFLLSLSAHVITDGVVPFQDQSVVSNFVSHALARLGFEFRPGNPTTGLAGVI